MKGFGTIVSYGFKENLKNKWIFIYCLVLLVPSYLLYYFGGTDSEKGASLFQLILLLIPLFNLLFGSLAFESYLPFIRLAVMQNISRKVLFWGKYFSLNLSLALALGVVFLLHLLLGSITTSGLGIIWLFALLLQLVFTSIAFLVASIVRKREFILGSVLIIWLYLYIFYDFIILQLGVLSIHVSMDTPIFLAILFNPLDITRVAFLLQLDIPSLFSFTTAHVHNITGDASDHVAHSGAGVHSLIQHLLDSILSIILFGFGFIMWIFAPMSIGAKIFARRDL